MSRNIGNAELIKWLKENREEVNCFVDSMKAKKIKPPHLMYVNVGGDMIRVNISELCKLESKHENQNR